MCCDNCRVFSAVVLSCSDRDGAQVDSPDMAMQGRQCCSRAMTCYCCISACACRCCPSCVCSAVPLLQYTAAVSRDLVDVQDLLQSSVYSLYVYLMIQRVPLALCLSYTSQQFRSYKHEYTANSHSITGRLSLAASGPSPCIHPAVCLSCCVVCLLACTSRMSSKLSVSIYAQDINGG